MCIRDFYSPKSVFFFSYHRLLFDEKLLISPGSVLTMISSLTTCDVAYCSQMNMTVYFKLCFALDGGSTHFIDPLKIIERNFFT